MPRWLNVANLFTLLRLVLVPFVIHSIIHGRHFLALVLFALAAVTDILDGAAARHSGTATPEGAYLDPIADKCLLSGVFVALAVAGTVPWWLVVVIFARDAYIVLAAGVMILLTPVRSFPPSVWGKASTFVQILTAATWLGRNALQLRALDAVSSAMLWPCAVFTIWSGIHYTWNGVRLARAR